MHSVYKITWKEFREREYISNKPELNVSHIQKIYSRDMVHKLRILWSETGGEILGAFSTLPASSP